MSDTDETLGIANVRSLPNQPDRTEGAVERVFDELLEPVPMASAGPARQLHAAAALLSASVLFDSAIEHYRGSFKNSAMFMPLVSATLNIGSSTHGLMSRDVDAHPLRTLSYGAAIAVGALGTGFHVYNVTKRVGGIRWENLFYGAPIGAPAALALSGLVGLAADRIAANEKNSGTPTLLGLPAGPALAAMTSLGLMGTVGEAGLMHFRGSFHNPAMYLPVILPPVAAAVLAEAAFRPTDRSRGTAKTWLGITSVLGIAGVALHCYGVSRAMGGWKNWRQNALDGPPIPAPPSFSALAIAGLAALSLIEKAKR